MLYERDTCQISKLAVLQGLLCCIRSSPVSSGPAQTVSFDGWFVNCLVMDTTRTVSRQFHGTFLWLIMLGGNVKQNTSTDKHFSSYNL